MKMWHYWCSAFDKYFSWGEASKEFTKPFENAHITVVLQTFVCRWKGQWRKAESDQARSNSGDYGNGPRIEVETEK